MEQHQTFVELFVSTWLPLLLLVGTYLLLTKKMKRDGRFSNPMQDELEQIKHLLQEISQKLDKS